MNYSYNPISCTNLARIILPMKYEYMLNPLKGFLPVVAMHNSAAHVCDSPYRKFFAKTYLVRF